MNAPSVTVKDVWRSVLPEGTELLAGGGGLERRVEWACALRTRPPAFDAVKGGEMAFVPVRSIRLIDERLDLAQVMTSFAEKGGVAFAVTGDVSAASIDIADRLVMPLLRLPASVHIADVHQLCVRFILDQRTLLHERAQELQTTLMQLALSGAGMPAIVERLSEITGLAAMWLDERGLLRHAAGDGAEDVAVDLDNQRDGLLRWGQTVALIAADPPVREIAMAGANLVASPIPSRDGVGGFILLAADHGDIDQMSRLAVARAASASSIELDRERVVTETRERLEGEFIESLLSGTFVSDDAVQERARRLGVQLASVVVVLAFRGSKPGDATWEQAAVSVSRASIARRHAAALVGSHHGAACALLSFAMSPDESAIARLAETVRADVARATGDTGTNAGMGRPESGSAGVQISYREAEHALAMGRTLLGDGVTASFARLGLHRLLFSLSQQAELAEFYNDTVGPLVAYDARTGGDLMRTLDALFTAHGSPTEAAQRLNLHRNTVLYRLRRVEEVGSLDLDDPATRLNLQLCLRIREVLDASGAGPRRLASRSR